MTILEPPRAPDPRCKGKCQGDRAAWESPATMVQTADGPRPACPCCGYTLTRDPSTEWGRPPNLRDDVANETIRFNDDICRYDVVYVKDVKPKE